MVAKIVREIKEYRQLQVILGVLRKEHLTSIRLATDVLRAELDVIQ